MVLRCRLVRWLGPFGARPTVKQPPVCRLSTTCRASPQPWLCRHQVPMATATSIARNICHFRPDFLTFNYHLSAAIVRSCKVVLEYVRCGGHLQYFQCRRPREVLRRGTYRSVCCRPNMGCEGPPSWATELTIRSHFRKSQIVQSCTKIFLILPPLCFWLSQVLNLSGPPGVPSGTGLETERMQQAATPSSLG